MEDLDFSEEEIQHQLAALGYKNIPKQRLREFKRDLDLLICHERSKSQTSAECNTSKSQSSSVKSPPAVTKEKVDIHRTGFNDSNIYFHCDAAYQGQTSAFNDDGDMSHGLHDAYVKYSVAPRYIRPSTAPNRLEVEDVPSDGHCSVLNTVQTVSADIGLHTSGKPAIRRKVLRKHRGQSQICDESTSSDNSESVSELEERLDRLRVCVPRRRCDLDFVSEESDSYRDTHSSTTELPSAFQAYIKALTRSRSESDIRSRPKSFIRPVMDHPHTRNLKKTDPVAKYFQYKQDWELFKAPGERSRKELHWAIREQLMYQPPPPKPQRTYIPNSYVVPTAKKRSALRWEIRHDLANGIIPTKITYP